MNHTKTQPRFRTIGFIVCVLLIALCSCNSSKHAYKKRRKPAPCDCPKFNYAPPTDKTLVFIS